MIEQDDISHSDAYKSLYTREKAPEVSQVILSNIHNTMSDSAVTEKKFNDKIQKDHDEAQCNYS